MPEPTSGGVPVDPQPILTRPSCTRAVSGGAMGRMTTTPVHELLTDDLVITDAGLETVMVFLRGLDLPGFAAFPLVEQDEGRRHLAEYMDEFVTLADKHGAGLILETPTWRANPDWGADQVALYCHEPWQLSAGQCQCH